MQCFLSYRPTVTTRSRVIWDASPDVWWDDPAPRILRVGFQRAGEGPWRRRGIAPDIIPAADGAPALRRFFYREETPKMWRTITGHAARYLEVIVPELPMTAAPRVRPILLIVSDSVTPSSEGLARAAFAAAKRRSSGQDDKETS